MKEKKKAEDFIERIRKTRRKVDKSTRRKKYLKKRVSIECNCERRDQHSDRAKYGVCRCDAYSMNYTLGQVLANYLWQYIADAKGFIIRDDWDIIEQHAKNIEKYLEPDLEKDNTDFKKALEWLGENWGSMWW